MASRVKKSPGISSASSVCLQPSKLSLEWSEGYNSCNPATRSTASIAVSLTFLSNKSITVILFLKSLSNRLKACPSPSVVLSRKTLEMSDDGVAPSCRAALRRLSSTCSTAHQPASRTQTVLRAISKTYVAVPRKLLN